jgi:hypothetical protein
LIKCLSRVNIVGLKDNEKHVKLVMRIPINLKTQGSPAFCEHHISQSIICPNFYVILVKDLRAKKFTALGADFKKFNRHNLSCEICIEISFSLDEAHAIFKLVF